MYSIQGIDNCFGCSSICCTSQLEGPGQHLLTVLLSIPFNHLPWSKKASKYVSTGFLSSSLHFISIILSKQKCDKMTKTFCGRSLLLYLLFVHFLFRFLHSDFFRQIVLSGQFSFMYLFFLTFSLSKTRTLFLKSVSYLYFSFFAISLHIFMRRLSRFSPRYDNYNFNF